MTKAFKVNLTAPTVTSTSSVVNSGELGGTATNQIIASSIGATTSNGDSLRTKFIRLSTGTTWTTAQIRIQRTVGVTDMGYIGFGGTSTYDVRIGVTSTDIAIFAPTAITLSQPTAITGTTTVNTNATSYVKQSATAAPTVDMFQIDNTGFGITTAGISALQVNYIGGAAAVEASAARIDVTPGTTSGGTWNGLRIFPSAAPVSGVTYNALKFDTVSVGAGTENVIYVGTGYSNIINYNGTTVINGTGQVNLASVTGALAVANGGTGITSFGTGVATFLGTPTSANLRTAVATTSTGTGSLVFGTSPTFTTSYIVSGTSSGSTTIQASAAASGTLTLPASTGTISTEDAAWFFGLIL